MWRRITASTDTARTQHGRSTDAAPPVLTRIAVSSSVQLFLAGAAPRMSAENMSGAASTANKLNLCVRDRMRQKGTRCARK